MLASLACAPGGWLAVIGRAALPSEKTARASIVPQVRDETKWMACSEAAAACCAHLVRLCPGMPATAMMQTVDRTPIANARGWALFLVVCAGVLRVVRHSQR